MTDRTSLETSLAQLSKFLVGDMTMLDTLHRVAALATDAVVPAAFCGLTMLVDGEPRTGVFTDPASPEIDQAQYDADTGPCLDAFRTGEIFRIDSTPNDFRWPEFSAACVDHGILSTASFPMVFDDVRRGAMNLYSKQEAAFGAEQIATGREFAAQAGVVIAYARSYWNARQISQNLETAMVHRAEIEQAKGIIMATTGCTADEAFEYLARQSQHENRKLREIAIELVEGKIHRPCADRGGNGEVSGREDPATA
jgi:GAF domain-containing protein